MGIGSAHSRLPDGEVDLRRTIWQLARRKANLGKENLDARGTQTQLYKLADILTTLTRQHNGVVGDAARVLGGALVAAPVEAANIHR